MGGEGGDRVDDGMVVLARGAEVGAEREEYLGAGDRAPAAADLLLELDHSQVALGEVVIERDLEVVGEAKDLLAVTVQAHDQVSGRRLLDHAALARGDRA